MAFSSLRLARGDRILTSAAEYASNFIPFLQVARRTGAIVDVVPSDPDGQVSVGALQGMIDDRVKLISLTYIPTNGGLVNPARAVGAVARRAGVPFILDACQAVGQMPVDVREIGCDVLSATGRKFLRGPRAVGFLYVRRDFLNQLEPSLVDMHGATWVSRDTYALRPDARRFENFESNAATKLGLGVAVDYAMAWGLEAIRDRAWGLAATLRTKLPNVPGVTVRDIGAESRARSHGSASTSRLQTRPRPGWIWKRAGFYPWSGRRSTTTTPKKRSTASAPRSTGLPSRRPPGWRGRCAFDPAGTRSSS